MTDDHIHVFDAGQLVEAGHGPTCRECGFEAPPLPDTDSLSNDDRLALERHRIAQALFRYFEDGPSSYRTLLDYLDLGYGEGLAEGWLDFNNAIAGHDSKIAKGEREP